MPAFAYATSDVSRPYASSRRAMRLTTRVTYPFFFAAVLARRCNPLASRETARHSIFAETRARAAAIVPFIFMG